MVANFNLTTFPWKIILCELYIYIYIGSSVSQKLEMIKGEYSILVRYIPNDP